MDQKPKGLGGKDVGHLLVCSEKEKKNRFVASLSAPRGIK
jgi:hypothetical protein